MIKAKRVRALAEELQKRGLDAIYLGPSTDLEYVSGLQTHPDERVRGLLIGKNGVCVSITPKLYKEEMMNAFSGDAQYEEWDDSEGFTGAFERGLKALGALGGKVAFNDGVRAIDMLAIQDAMEILPCNGGETLSALRSTKDEEELALMRKASGIADGVLEKLRHFIKPGMMERHIAEAIPKLLEELGADTISFSPIVATGPNGSMPHYGGNKRVIEDNDVVLLDFGGRCSGYCSDVTRTFFVGEPTEEQKKVYEIVRLAQEAGEAAVRPGATGQDVDRAARKVIIDAGYGEYFFNRVGHGIGIAVHETPYMIEGNNEPLRPGNVFSVEPGIYLPGKFGVRIENLVAVRPDGTGEALNKFPRELTKAV